MKWRIFKVDLRRENLQNHKVGLRVKVFKINARVISMYVLYRLFKMLSAHSHPVWTHAFISHREKESNKPLNVISQAIDVVQKKGDNARACTFLTDNFKYF